jgi:hypothetical protein
MATNRSDGGTRSFWSRKSPDVRIGRFVLEVFVFIPRRIPSHPCTSLMCQIVHGFCFREGNQLASRAFTGVDALTHVGGHNLVK